MHIPASFEGSWIDAPLDVANREFRRHFGDDVFDRVYIDPKVLLLCLFGFLWVTHQLYAQWKLRVDAPFVTAGRGPFFIRSWRSSIQWIVNAKSLVDKGYYEHKYKTGAFQVPTLSGNHVFVCSNELVDELRNAPHNALSFGHRTADILQAEFTIGTDIFFKPYHIPFIRNQLTRGLDRFTVPLMKEFALAIEQRMGVGNDTGEWKALKAYDLTLGILVTGMSRVFVGEELCRNVEYLKTTIDFTQHLFIAAHLMQLVPTLGKYLISPFINEMFINKALRTSKKLLGPIIEDRKRWLAEEGRDWKGKPDDFLQWLIEGSPESEQSIDALVMRMTEVNMSALHTTGLAVYQNFIALASYPQHIPQLRHEMEQTIQQHGWTKVAMSKMVKLDSFIKEAMRLNGPSVILMGRKAIGKGFTFSNGLHIPPGVTISIPDTVHTDQQEYGENAHDFDGFRFSRPHEIDEGIEGIEGMDSKDTGKRKYFTTTGVNYLKFGHGQGACPGRFFATHEMKIILCLILMNYDIKLVDTPKPIYFTMHRGPDLNARIAFRKRGVESSAD